MHGVNPRQRKSFKRRLLAAHGPICALCRRRFTAEELTLDHIIPRGDGGPNSYWNMRLACYPCNYRRHH